MPDEALYAALEEKLRGRGGIRYAAIAMHAQAIGRNSLATLLLELEPCAAQQVTIYQAASVLETSRGLIASFDFVMTVFVN